MACPVPSIDPSSTTTTWRSRPVRSAASRLRSPARVTSRRLYTGTATTTEMFGTGTAYDRTTMSTTSHGPTSLVIALVWPYADWGGAQTHLLALARELSEHHRIVAFVPADPSVTLRDLISEVGVRGDRDRSRDPLVTDRVDRSQGREAGCRPPGPSGDPPRRPGRRSATRCLPRRHSGLERDRRGARSAPDRPGRPDLPHPPPVPDRHLRGSPAPAPDAPSRPSTGLPPARGHDSHRRLAPALDRRLGPRRRHRNRRSPLGRRGPHLPDHRGPDASSGSRPTGRSWEPSGNSSPARVSTCCSTRRPGSSRTDGTSMCSSAVRVPRRSGW